METPVEVTAGFIETVQPSYGLLSAYCKLIRPVTQTAALMAIRFNLVTSAPISVHVIGRNFIDDCSSHITG